MTSSGSDGVGDPLTTALPPATDYITYLTILEYQLNGRNIHTLNDLLKADDGTLAREIGWDLLRIVLEKMLEAPAEAKDCLDIIARRGNPREVVVRIAEELEKLGWHDDDDFSPGSDEDTADQNLQTFSGEADRIHLGNMKLDGMPEAKELKSKASQDDSPPGKEPLKSTPDPLKFTALLSMLSIVHPRIKTQYPSRFLATSLPAALAAYRRFNNTYEDSSTCETTAAFLDCLSKLAGRERPPLPLRPSTAGSVTDAQASAPLPDPEAQTEANEGTNIASQSEKDIITRLLEAVMLEILDEYMSSLQGNEVPSMMWTRRIREASEPARVVPGRSTVTSIFEKPPLIERDVLPRRFQTLSKTLNLDVQTEIDRRTIDSPDQSDRPPRAPDTDDEASEYPTSPSQIEFSDNGLLHLAAALSFMQPTVLNLTLSQVATLFAHNFILSETPQIPSPAIQDALHILLYRNLTSHAATATSADIDSDVLHTLMATLTQMSTTTPDPQTRDDAHFLCTTLLHKIPSPTTRLSLITQTLLTTYHDTNPDSPSHNPSVPLATPFTEGALKAIAVSWLKHDLLLSLSPNTPSDAASYTDANTHITLPTLLTDPTLTTLLFNPQIPSTTDTTHLPHLLLQLPYHISLLNFCTVLIARLPTAGSDLSNTIRTKSTALLGLVKPWAVVLGKKVADREPEIEGATTDIYALEDAVARLEGLLE